MAVADDFDSAAQAYHDNADYEAAASVTKAHAYVTACRRLLQYPAESQDGQSSVGFSKSVLERQISEARAWIQAQSSANGGRARTHHVGFGNFRQ